MFTTLYIRELQNYLYSLRFQVSFVIVVLVFTLGSVSFASSFKDMHDNYTKYSVAQQEAIGKQAENISKVATARNSFIISPRENSVIADCKESYLPNRITYSAYNVFDYSVRHDSNNPLLIRTDSLSPCSFVLLRCFLLLMPFQGKRRRGRWLWSFQMPCPGAPSCAVSF